MCNIWKRKSFPELSVEEIDRFFKISNKFSWIDLTGGEIFLRDDLYEIVQIILNRNKDLALLHFPTNGFNTDKILNIIDLIISNNKKIPKIIISVSIDGPPLLNDKIRGIEGAWEHSAQTYIELKKNKNIDVYIGMTLCAINYHLVESTVESLIVKYPMFKYNDLHLNIFHKSSIYYANKNISLNYTEKNIDDFIHHLNKFIDKRKFPKSPVEIIEKIYLRKIDQYFRTKKTPIGCEALRGSCFIDPAGNIYPCAIWNCKISNIKENNYLTAVWKDTRTKKKRLQIYYKNCPNCWTPCEAYQSILGNIFRLVV